MCSTVDKIVPPSTFNFDPKSTKTIEKASRLNQIPQFTFAEALTIGRLYIFRHGAPNQRYPPPANAIEPKHSFTKSQPEDTICSPPSKVPSLTPWKSHDIEERQSASFFKLPRELRDSIYDECLRVPGIISVQDQNIDAYYGHCPTPLLETERYKITTCVPLLQSQCHGRARHVQDPEWWGQFSREEKRLAWKVFEDAERDRSSRPISDPELKPLLTNLLRVCRQIHFEAAERLYRQTFGFAQATGCLITLQEIPRSFISARYAPMIKSLRFHCWWTDLRGNRVAWTRLCKDSFSEILKTFPKLKTLTIVLPRHPWNVYPWEREASKAADGSNKEQQFLYAPSCRHRRSELKFSSEELEFRMFVWFWFTFCTTGAKVPEQIEFEIEDPAVDGKMVKRAWKRFKARQNRTAVLPLAAPG